MKVTLPTLLIALPAATVAGSVPAWAQVFAGEAQALEVAFGAGATVTRQEQRLSPEDRARLEQASGLRFPEPSYTFLVAERAGTAAGYALVMNEIGKTEPITFLVSMGVDGKVGDVVIMTFRESRGWEVKEKRFTQQFRGKRVSDPLRINQDVLNYTGATLSSKAVARGVKRALLLLEHFYPAEKRVQPPKRGALPAPTAPVEIGVCGEWRLFRQARYRMGTVCELRVWARGGREAAGGFAAAFGEIARIEQVFSTFRQDSELAGVNRSAAAAVSVSSEFWRLTREGLRLSRATGGRFDLTAGALGRLWTTCTAEGREPSSAELQQALRKVGPDKLVLDQRRRTIAFRAPGMHLDFGGLAKGYAAERVGRMLAGAGFAGLVNLGESSLYAFGSEQQQRLPAWIVGITDPGAPRRAAALLLLPPGTAISTSGTYQRQRRASARAFGEITDPRTARALEGLRSATVIARSATAAEAFSKHLLLGGASPSQKADWIVLGDGGARRSLLRTVWLEPA